MTTTSSAIARRTLIIYRHTDETVEQQLAAHSVRLSCTKGCASCCYQLAKIDLASAITMAEEIRASSVWRGRLEELQDRLRADLALGVMTPDAYFAKQRPCALLDESARTCTIYNGRPPSCRYYFVVSPAALCGIENTTEPVSTPAIGTQAQLHSLDMAYQMMRRENLPMILGTMQNMLLMAFDFIEHGRDALFDPKYNRSDVTRLPDVEQ